MTDVLGVDACRDGWAGILLRADQSVVGLHAETIDALVATACEWGYVAAVGIDIPIGLPDRGRRRADVLARSLLGPRRSSVFVTPVRTSLYAESYDLAVEENRRLAGEGLSRQAFALRPRILEVEAWLGSAPAPVIEVHPEVSFCALTGAVVAAPKRTWAGFVARSEALAQAGIELPDDLGELAWHAGVDDVLDATVAAWTAGRHAAGVAVPLPDPPEVLADGSLAAIWS